MHNHQIINQIIILIGFIIVIIGVILDYKKYRKSLKQQAENFSNSIKQKDDTIIELYKIIEKTSQELNHFKSRTDELEGTIENGYGVSVRNIVTNVIAKFDKFEMVVIYSGIMKLLSSSSNIEDIEIYIKLADKIQSYMDDMKEKEVK